MKLVKKVDVFLFLQTLKGVEYRCDPVFDGQEIWYLFKFY